MVWSQPAESAVLNTHFTKYFPDLFSLLLITLNLFQGKQQPDTLSGYAPFSSPLGQALGHGFDTRLKLVCTRAYVGNSWFILCNKWPRLNCCVSVRHMLLRKWRQFSHPSIHSSSPLDLCLLLDAAILDEHFILCH